MKLFFILLFILVSWLKIAVIPMPVEILLIAILASTFVFKTHEALFIAMIGGMIMDYFSVLPFGIITLSMIASIIFFIFFKKNFSLNIKTFFVSLFVSLFFYYIFLWVFGGLIHLLFVERPLIDLSFKALFSRVSFLSVLYNGILISLAVYFINKKYIHDKFSKI